MTFPMQVKSGVACWMLQGDFYKAEYVYTQVFQGISILFISTVFKKKLGNSSVEGSKKKKSCTRQSSRFVLHNSGENVHAAL